MGFISKLREYRYIGSGLQYRNTINVIGEGKVMAKPDIALVKASVVSEGKNVTAVQDANTKNMNKIIEFLEDSGVKEKDIKTVNYNLNPRYVYREGAAPRIAGYSITQGLEIKIRDLDKVGQILEGTVTAGANQINSFVFRVDDDEELRAEAREIAIKEAKKKAKELASQLGVKLVKLSGYNESFSNPIMYKEMSYDMAGRGGGGLPNVQAGENEIIVNVNLSYEID